MLSTRALLLLALHWAERLLTVKVKEAVPGFLKQFLEINATNLYKVCFDLGKHGVPAEVTAEAMASGRKLQQQVTISAHSFPSRLGSEVFGPLAWGTG